MNILILGYGKTGQALANQLAQQGHQITALSRHPHSHPTILHLQQDILHLDVASTGIQYDWVYIILAPQQRTLMDYQTTFINTILPIYTALQHHPIQKVVLISSTRVYGEDAGQWIDDHSIPQTNDPYGQCLIAAEQLSAAYWQDKLIVIRPSGLYQATSQYLQQQAEQATKIMAQHWTNRIHREDFVGFLAYLLQLPKHHAQYVLSDELPVLQHEIWQSFRQRKQLQPLSCALDVPETGKRIMATHLQQSGYRLSYPTWQQGYGFA